VRLTTYLRIIVLTNLGEKMSDEEVDELLKAIDTSSGEINYTGMSTLVVCDIGCL
jgi:Ca2+-binding EF-hand superfamily protein